MRGSYSYTAPDGTVVTVTYIANENGFQPTGTHISVPGAAPAPQLLSRTAAAADAPAPAPAAAAAQSSSSEATSPPSTAAPTQAAPAEEAAATVAEGGDEAQASFLRPVYKSRTFRSQQGRY